MAVYACSDLHGMKSLYDKICNFLEPDDIVYFLGDATDRGPQSWETFKAIAANPQFIYIKGNHEDMLQKAMIEHIDFDNTDWFHHYELLCYNGGYETFLSWIEEGENKNWISFIRDLPIYMTYKNVCGQTIHLSHAGFNYQEDDTIPAPKQLLWDRKHIKYQYMFGPVSNEKNIIVHGHTPVSNFRNADNPIGMVTYNKGTKICIDGGSYSSKYTILLDLDNFSEYIFFSDNNEKGDIE